MNREQYTYDYEKLVKSFEGFREKLGIFGNLNKGDKIGFGENDSIYIDTSSYIQGLTRWYYKQNRDVVMMKIDSIVREYLLYLQYVDSVYTNTTNIQYASIVKNLIKRINQLSNSIIGGLDILRETYEGDKQVEKKIMSLKNSTDYRTRQLTDYCW